MKKCGRKGCHERIENNQRYCRTDDCREARGALREECPRHKFEYFAAYMRKNPIYFKQAFGEISIKEAWREAQGLTVIIA